MKYPLHFIIILLFALFPTLGTSARAAGTYPGCAVPSSSFVKEFTATPSTLNSILGVAAAGDVIYLDSSNYGAVSISNRKYSEFLTMEAVGGGLRYSHPFRSFCESRGIFRDHYQRQRFSIAITQWNLSQLGFEQ